MNSNKQTTSSEGQTSTSQGGLPGTPPHTHAVPADNSHINTNTTPPSSPSENSEHTLSLSQSTVVAKSTPSQDEGEQIMSPLSDTTHKHSRNSPSITRTSNYLITPVRSYFSPPLDAGTAPPPAVNSTQTWVNSTTNSPPPPQTLPQNTNTNTTTSTRIIPPIIIDNITIAHTQSETLAQITKQFPDIQITKKQFLLRGGLALTPKHPKDANTISLIKNWDVAFFGPHIYIHLAHKDLRPWYCINRIPLDMQDSVIRTALGNHRTPSGQLIHPEGIHRNTKGPLPTNLYIFKVKDSTTGKSITDTDITIDGKQYRIRKFIQSGVLRCTKCQGFGHLWKGCKKPKKCVRCSGPNCTVGDCKKPQRKCANCGGGHSAAMKTCPERKKQMREFYLREKSKTYTSNLNSKLMSQQKDQMDQNDFLRKRAQDLTQENTSLKARLSKLEISQKSAINAEQLGEILTRIFLDIIPLESPLASKGVARIIKEDISNVMQGGNPSSPTSPNPDPDPDPNTSGSASPTSTTTTPLTPTDALLDDLLQSSNNEPTTPTFISPAVTLTDTEKRNCLRLRSSARKRTQSLSTHF